MIIFVVIAFFIIWLIDYRKVEKGKAKIIFWVIFGIAFIPSLLLAAGVKIPPVVNLYESVIKKLHLNI